ncbi:hybrid sensor histidine kinase/response regulator [Flavivirga aquatica]|uniref:histidine kinase n=1 Tax=Flavivirga aquatica TaxID=1849968 RepID=A0A1E5SHT8_9FLAO|nr:two-component regulator propeller domain-containing protein [Flavivirga aquatica]OEJ98682.1 hybrid sensor histidine kinase/response regulator [Flavivirga aquatica]
MIIQLIYFRNKLFYILIIFLLSLVGCYGQNNINFEHLTTNDGLSQSDINCIYQDDEGFMWFGTFDGLNKYDGYKFINYVPESNNEESISSNIIYTITGDKKGDLWIGTTGGGLNRFNKKTNKFTRYKHDRDDINSISSDYISNVYFDDQKKRLWVATNKGLDLLDFQKPEGASVFKHINFKKDIAIKVIHQDKYGDLWCASNRQLFKILENREGGYDIVNFNHTFLAINYLGEDKSGRLLIGSSNNLFVKDNINGVDKISKVLLKAPTQALVIDDKNQYWIGNNNGLFQFDYTKDKKLQQKNHFVYDPINPNSISKNVIRALYKDRTGIIWVGTNGGGVNKIDPNKKQFQHIKKTSNLNSLSYDKIRSLYEDSDNNLWVGTEGGGLNILAQENDNGKFNKFKKITNILKIFALEEVTINNRKVLLIGTGDISGLYMLDIDNAIKNDKPQIELLIKTNNAVFTILQDKKKNIWIGTYGGGIYRMIPEKDTNNYKVDVFKHNPQNNNSISDNIIRNIYQDKKGDIWFGTGNGLSKLDSKELLKENPRFKVYRNIVGDISSISHNYILPIYENNEGELYVGTFGGGLNKYIPAENNQKERFVRYSHKDGLPNNVIKAILEDESGYLWLSTNKGLSKFNTQKETFKNYDVNDGLQNNEFQELASLKRSNGSLLFGGINGFNVFSSNEINDNILPAETVISNFSVFNKEVKVGEEYNGNILLNNSINYTDNIDLTYNQNSFSIEFAGLHYGAPLKNKFSYILEGYDKDWILSPSDKRFANYTNIPYGEYTFKVKASNSDGIWDATPKVIKLNISPPFWKTIGAYLSYVLLTLILLYAFRKFTIIKSTRKHQLELEYIEKEKQEELQQAKLEFFTNISHEFRTPLTLIKGPLEYLIDKESVRNNVEVQEQYEIMSRNTDYLLRLVNQLLDFRKISQGKMRLVLRNTDILNFIREIGEPFQFIAHKQNIIFNIESAHENIKMWFDHDALEKIIKNLLSNAFKFTHEKGEVTIKISKENKETESDTNHVIIEVKNTGYGISEDEIKNIFNRFYTKKNKNKSFQTGVGIGLSFTKNLLNFHQGSIDVKSVPNESVSFIVKLPQGKSVYEKIPEISIKEKTESDFDARTSEKESFAIDLNDEITDSTILNTRSKLPLVLVVDDNDDIRTFIKRALSDTFKILEANNGEEGLRIANEMMPHLVLTDLVMPVMDGIELCNSLKSQSETSHIPIIMLTAKTSNESEIEGLKIGADGYIKKPFDINILKLKLSNILKYREELRRKFNREITLQPEEVTVTSLDEKFLQQAIEIVEKHMMNTDFSVELLVKEMGFSRSNLYIKLKGLTGLSSSAFIRNIRLKRAVQLLEQSDFSVKEIMYMTGFNTSSYFSKCFKKQFGVLPREYVKKIKQEKVKFEI